MYGPPPGAASVAQNHVQQGLSSMPVQNVGALGHVSNIPISQNHVHPGMTITPIPVQTSGAAQPPGIGAALVSQNHIQSGMPPISSQSSAGSIGPVPVAKYLIQPGMPASSMQNSGQSHPAVSASVPVIQNNIQSAMPPTSQQKSGQFQPSTAGPATQNHIQSGIVPNPGSQYPQVLPPTAQNHNHQGMPPVSVQNAAPNNSGLPSASQNHIRSEIGNSPSLQNPGSQNTPGQPHMQNHVQSVMPPMPTASAAAPGAQIPKRYPAYPQQPPISGPVGTSQTYPSFPQPHQQQFQQPGMQMQPQLGQDGGFYGGPGMSVGQGSQYPRQVSTTPQVGMAQPNYPQYGQQPAQYGHGPAPPAYTQPSAQQGQKRLDPDQMPSAIGVMQEDQQTRGGIFRTDQKGLLPPLVTTKFQIEDFGNASPRFVRSTMYSVPAQLDMLKQTAIPFALVINPFESPAKDEQAVPCVDLGPMGPVRCIRCKAYMSPLMQFIDGGRRFQCLLCKAITEVPPEYFQHLDHTGQRVDKWERPELWRGTYEYIATAEYCRNNVLPKEPAFVFVIDVSYNNVKSGLINLLCSQMKNLIESLPSHTPVGFITYNSKVHFYNIDPALGQPQMVIVPDVADMFMPLLKGFLVPRAEAIDAVESLMEQIPALFGDTKETEAVLGPAVVAGMEALKASNRVGKLLVFHSSLPTSDIAPGKLKNREADRKLLGTDKEKTVLVPQSTYYNTLGQDCVGAGVSVDLYLFNNSYIDVATIGQVARLTGGSVNKYTYFQADIDGPRVIGDIILHLSRHIGFDSVMRVRTSTGVRPTDFYGHYYMANTTDVELAAIDSQKGLAVEIKHDASITDEDGVYIQVALLYTTIYGTN
ncbi:unnamed protein product [Orchesella dallaii]|uniref:Protein transport protein Sec24C n=1 Tax=Orchesella dallaii TaxID=48710 RepID=A0ABP1PZB0_9HEXA